jgi:hypothetical protein
MALLQTAGKRLLTGILIFLRTFTAFTLQVGAFILAAAFRSV